MLAWIAMKLVPHTIAEYHEPTSGVLSATTENRSMSLPDEGRVF